MSQAALFFRFLFAALAAIGALICSAGIAGQLSEWTAPTRTCSEIGAAGLGFRLHVRLAECEHDQPSSFNRHSADGRHLQDVISLGGQTRFLSSGGGGGRVTGAGAVYLILDATEDDHVELDGLLVQRAGPVALGVRENLELQGLIRPVLLSRPGGAARFFTWVGALLACLALFVRSRFGRTVTPER